METSTVQSEVDIIRGLQRGNLDAWDALCTQYGNRVWAHISRLIGADAAAVADVFQETMLAVADSGRRLRTDSRLWAWLAGIAHRQAALHWRRVYRDRNAGNGPAELSGDVDAQGSGEDGPEWAADRKETIQVVRYVLAQMRSEYVVVLVAKYMDDMSVTQIVDAIGGTNESVRSRLARARTEFREKFDGISTGAHRLDETLWQQLSSDVGHPS